jgi:hypothetical protein
MTTKQVYVAIAAVTKEMSKFGISKDHKNQQQGYKFRGIDDVYNALSPVLADNNLCIIPRMVKRNLLERQTKSGGALFYVTVKAEFDFVSAIDGSIHTAVTYGEAMDSADKATNKAMSAAFKYAAFQTFCIPTEGDNDADATTHEVAPKQASKKASKTTSKPEPKEPPKPLSDEDYEALRSSIANATDLEALKNAWLIAQQKAKDASDKLALEGFVKVKDIRKGELDGGVK